MLPLFGASFSVEANERSRPRGAAARPRLTLIGIATRTQPKGSASLDERYHPNNPGGFLEGHREDTHTLDRKVRGSSLIGGHLFSSANENQKTYKVLSRIYRHEFGNEY